jgi:hypothetical protein
MKKLFFFLLIFTSLSACSNDKENDKKSTTIDYENINTCSLTTYQELAAILDISLTEFSEDLSHIQINSSGSKSCTFIFNKSNDPTKWHGIIVYLSQKIEGSFPYEQSLNGLLSAGRVIDGNTIIPSRVNTSGNILLLWEYEYPYRTIEYQSHINEELLISVSYIVSSNIDFVPNAEDKLLDIFNLFVANIQN